jgi:crotonobetaine/carnitine-CoA ligase
VAGQLLARPREPFSMGNGYFNMPDATVAAWRNLWFHSGDLVVREEDGWYRFLDRMKDGIRRRGENISSTEVEEAIGSHPDVKVVAAFGVPAELSEEEVMVSVVPREGAHVDPLELVKHCEGRLAYYAIPRFIDLVDELPLTETGKVRKNLLRERGRSAETWDREAVGYEVSRV